MPSFAYTPTLPLDWEIQNEIKDNDWDLSINRYKEIVYKEIEYAAPSEIIKDIETLDQERNQALTALKEMLG